MVTFFEICNFVIFLNKIILFSKGIVAKATQEMVTLFQTFQKSIISHLYQQTSLKIKQRYLIGFRDIPEDMEIVHKVNDVFADFCSLAEVVF